MSPAPLYDLAIIGAGVNGAGIARDAAGRGLKVALIEAADIGGATSSASTKLIHGGLRYLEFYEFRLVAKALAEREVILSAAPHITWPQSFVLPYAPHLRPAWMIRAGLFLYDHLARREQVPGSAGIDLCRDPAGAPLAPELTRAFRYWDGWVDDARLVLLNVRDAADRGADIRTRTKVVSASRGAHWTLELDDGSRIEARKVINAAGPWAGEVARTVLRLNDAPELKLVQGAHIVVPRIGPGDDAYMFQQPDGRIIFVIPYERDFTLIGTTETVIDHPGQVGATADEVDYLLGAANRYLARQLTPADIVHRFAGVRPLVLESDKDARETTRDWKFIDHGGDVLTIVGGKITTYRVLAEAALALVAPETRPWTKAAPLPGGDVPRRAGETGQQAFARWLRGLKAAHRDVPADAIERMARIHGRATETLLAGGLGEDLGGVYTAELERFVTREWARTAEDVLWRRTKLGLHLDEKAKQRVADWFASRFTKA
jgi:glycerol-3-phosphate dehydrogenase